LPALALRQNHADGFVSPQEKPTMDRQRAIIEGTQTGLRMLLAGKFDDEEPFHVIAAFVMQKVEDANVGEVTHAMAALLSAMSRMGPWWRRQKNSFVRLIRPT
jgi:hypothetical protein